MRRLGMMHIDDLKKNDTVFSMPSIAFQQLAALKTQYRFFSEARKSSITYENPPSPYAVSTPLPSSTQTSRSYYTNDFSEYRCHQPS